MEPTGRAFSVNWPDVEVVNLLDDALTADRERTPELSEQLIERFVEFLKYAHQLGAEGLLITCSAFGPAIERAQAELPLPVVKPNESMFQEALALGPNVGMLATFRPAVDTMTAEFNDEARRARRSATLHTVLVEGAMDRLRAGDTDGHNQLVADQAAQLKHCDAVMLGHFSTSRAAAAVRLAVTTPVLTAPDAAVTKLRNLVLMDDDTNSSGR